MVEEDRVDNAEVYGKAPVTTTCQGELFVRQAQADPGSGKCLKRFDRGSVEQRCVWVTRLEQHSLRVIRYNNGSVLHTLYQP